ncbi:unnamed protein product [Plutella xylostella]|uniref:(diamondback moth) hypothetical protein n=1 Tax=Plutella xylostella TaxID=51655 RepID=A0A8S4EQ19_PLUXY|nr:unnamed protein product [Plutella xylostella]
MRPTIQARRVGRRGRSKKTQAAEKETKERKASYESGFWEARSHAAAAAAAADALIPSTPHSKHWQDSVVGCGAGPGRGARGAGDGGGRLQRCARAHHSPVAALFAQKITNKQIEGNVKKCANNSANTSERFKGRVRIARGDARGGGGGGGGIPVSLAPPAPAAAGSPRDIPGTRRRK